MVFVGIVLPSPF